METHRRHLSNRSKVALRQDAVDARKLDIHLESDCEAGEVSAYCAATILSQDMPTIGVVLSVAPLDLVDEQALRGDTFVDVTEALHKDCASVCGIRQDLSWVKLTLMTAYSSQGLRGKKQMILQNCTPVSSGLPPPSSPD